MKKQTTRPKDKLSLEGDGIIENFFHVLWAKDPLFGTIPSVYVPHTVIMRYNEPIAWYFMKDGGLKKKTKKNLNLEHVRDVFIRNKTDSGIVAVFMRYMKQENTEKPNVVFEYFNEKEFSEFISNNRQVNNGILQQFIQPKGDKNYIIKANWSPKLCFFEKIESLTKINDPKYDIYDRVLTIEAEKYHSKEGPVRGYVLPNKVQRICANIAQHVQNVSFESILLARMILHFKIDSNSRIWLLACTSLRLDHGLDEKINERLKLSTESVQMKYRPEDYLSKIKTPDNIKTNIIKGKPINMHKIFACLSCNIRLEPSSVFETPYRTIIEGYEWDHLKEKHRNNMQSIMKPKYNNIDEILERLQGMPLDIDDSPEDEVTSHIPPLIKKLYPKLKDVEYLVLRQHLGFLKKTAILCEECILHIQNSHEAGLRAQKQSQKEFYGTGRLKPENVKFRQEETKRNIRKLGISSQTMTSFPKFLSSKSARVKTEEGFEPSSARSKRNSELPVLYSELAAAKDYIATNPNLDNEGDYDDGNLSFNSDREVERPKELTNRVAVAIKMARPVTVAAAAKPKDTKDGIKKHIDLNPNMTNRRVMSISTLKNRAIIERIAKKENSLSSASGLFSARSEQTRLKSHQSTSKELTELGVTQTTSSSIIQTLKIYMPKKKFLRAEYKSVKSISGANTDRTIDTVERVLETEGNNSARDHYYHL